jgi:uncharacterized protein YciI
VLAGRTGTVGAWIYPAAMANFLVTMEHGPSWDAARGTREQDGWAQHAAFMDDLVAEGFVIIGGPVGDGRAVLAVEAADEEAVRSRLTGDPWLPMGLLHVGSVQEWQLWLDGRRLQAGSARLGPRPAHG